MRTPTLVTALALSLSTACDQQADLTCFSFAGDEVCVEEQQPDQCGVSPLVSVGIGTSPGAWNNGKDLNGVNLNGLNLNALTSNGIDLNALTSNGTTVDGAGAGSTIVGLALPARLPQRTQDRPVLAQALTDTGVLLEVQLAYLAGDPEVGFPPHYQATLANGADLCRDGRGGLLVPGLWAADGSRSDGLEVDGVRFDHSFSCRHGVIGKCVTWGYDPEVVGADLHQACTRLARADYCGDGTPYTENGTAVDIFDTAGVQVSEGDSRFEFEAGWGPDGAVCVSHPRYYDLDRDNQAIPPHCWMDLPRCDDWQQAQDRQAMLGNASIPTIRRDCR